MSDQHARTPRQVAIADHLWDTLAAMAADMGVDRESLVNQALFAFARQNGYHPSPGRAQPPIATAPAPSAAGPVLPPPVLPPPAPAPVPAPVHTSPPPSSAPQPAPLYTSPPPIVAPPQPFAQPPAGARFEELTPPSAMPTPLPPPPGPSLEEPPVGATASLRSPRPSAAPPPAPPLPFAQPPPQVIAPPPAFGPASVPPQSAPDLGTKMSPDEARAAREHVLQKAAELERERLVRGSEHEVDDDLLGPAAESTPEPVPLHSDGPVLVLYAEGREVDRVTGPRFLIGRGKHCDLIINSGKVSREHAAIVKEADGFFIEDLGSSNGTWFDKKRITRRKIDDGDEYFVCSEKITCRFQ